MVLMTFLQTKTILADDEIAINASHAELQSLPWLFLYLLQYYNIAYLYIVSHDCFIVR